MFTDSPSWRAGFVGWVAVRLAVKTVAALSLLAVVMLWLSGRDTAAVGTAAYGRLAALV